MVLAFTDKIYAIWEPHFWFGDIWILPKQLVHAVQPSALRGYSPDQVMTDADDPVRTAHVDFMRVMPIRESIRWKLHELNSKSAVP